MPATDYKVTSRLADVMTERGLSAEALASLTGLSITRIRSAIKPRAGAPTGLEMLRIAAALDLSVEQLFHIEASGVGRLKAVATSASAALFSLVRVLGALVAAYVLAAWVLANLPTHTPFLSSSDVATQRLIGEFLLFPSQAQQYIQTEENVGVQMLPIDPQSALGRLTIERGCDTPGIYDLKLASPLFANTPSLREQQARANCADLAGLPGQAYAARLSVLAQIPIAPSVLRKHVSYADYAITEAAQAACFRSTREERLILAPLDADAPITYASRVLTGAPRDSSMRLCFTLLLSDLRTSRTHAP